MPATRIFLNIWGPALLVCSTVIVGLLYQNTRMNDLKDAFNTRFDDLKDYIKSEFKRVDERIDRLEERIARLDVPLVRK
jgi:hypothetical protein